MKFVIITQWAYFPRVQGAAIILLLKFRTGVFSSALVVFLTARMCCGVCLVNLLRTTVGYRPRSLTFLVSDGYSTQEDG